MTKTATPTPEQIEDLRLGAVGIRRWMPEALPANEQGQAHFARALAEAAAEAIEAILPALAASPPTAVEPVAHRCQTCDGTGLEARHSICRDCDEEATPSTDLREENESQRDRAYQGMMDEVEALTGALHAAEARAATLSAENAVLRQHVEELQGKMKAVCACSYDNPGEVCDAHNPTVKALKERLETVEEAIKALVSLNDEYHPFGGETYQDRIERIWRRARAAIRKDKP